MAVLHSAMIGADLHVGGPLTRVRTIAIANGTLATAYAAGQVVNGVTLATDDRIALIGQTAPAENGLYTVNATGAPTRAVDFDLAADMKRGLPFLVDEGTHAKSVWIHTTAGTITVGTTALTFINFLDYHLLDASAAHQTTAIQYTPSFTVDQALDDLYELITGGSVATSEDPYFTGVVDVHEALVLSGAISPTALTTNTNDYLPSAGLYTSTTWRMTSTGNIDLTGISTPATFGHIVILHNVGSYTITLKNQNAGSGVNNRFAIGSDMPLPPNTSAMLRYDQTSNRWRAISTSLVPAPVPAGTNPNGIGLQYFNVLDYGALGDTIQDDTTFIQACMDAAAAAPGPASCKVVYFPFTGNSYLITAGLTLSTNMRLDYAYIQGQAGTYDMITWVGASNLSLQGDGVIDGGSVVGRVLVGSGQSETNIRSINFFGRYLSDVSDVVHFTGMSRSNIGPDVQITNGGRNGLVLEDCEDNRVDALFIGNGAAAPADPDGVAVMLTGSTSRTRIGGTFMGNSTTKYAVREDAAITGNDNILVASTFKDMVVGEALMVASRSRYVQEVSPANALVTHYWTALGSTPVTNQFDVSATLNGFSLSGDYYVNDLAGNYVVTSRLVAEVSTPLTTGAMVRISNPNKAFYVPPGVTGNILIGSWHDQQYGVGSGASLMAHKMASASLEQGTGIENINLLLEIFCERLP